jgi:putative ABC transport system substrate-binding protein
MRRRDFIKILGGAAAGCPVGVQAQQSSRMPLVAVLTGVADEPSAWVRAAFFMQGLQELGWTDGRNMRLDYRWVQATPLSLKDSVLLTTILIPAAAVADCGRDSLFEAFHPLDDR